MTYQAVVVDTNVVSYIHNGHTLAKLYKPYLLGAQTFISFQTLAEMSYGAKVKGWGLRRLKDLETALSGYTLIHTNEALVNRWCDVRAGVLKLGRHIDAADAWIAATALELDIPLVTHNARDFQYVDGLVVITETEV